MVDSGAKQIVAAFNALNSGPPYDAPSDPDPCPACGGDGWYIGHEDICYDSGDCHCSGVQVECECQREAVAPLDDGIAF